MNCQEFWNTMPELAEPANTRHLIDCPDCAIRMARQQELTAGFRALSRDLRHLEAPSRVAGRLRAAFRSQSGRRSMALTEAAGPVRRWWIPVLTWAAAAAMIAVALFLIRDRQPEATRPPASRGIELAMLELPGEMPGLYEAADTDSSDTGGFVPFGFIPLPSAARISASEDVNLVRVEVPRSSMIALGFEVSAERAAEPVQADVMLGADGTARAVRFLDESPLIER